MSAYHSSPEFGRLCDAVAYERLVVMTGSGVSAGLRARRSGRPLPSSWRAVLTQLRRRFGRRLGAVRRELELLLEPRLQGAEYLIEAATLMREAVGVAAFRRAVVEATTPAPGSYSKLHELIERIEPAGIITFNYDLGHENAWWALRGRSAGASLLRATYADEERLREVLAGDFGQRFLLKAHGCISRPRTIVLDRSSYLAIIARQRGYRAFAHHVLARFNGLIVGFGLSDPDFEDLLQTAEANFGGGVRDSVYIWKRGERRDEEARALVLRRRHGLECIFVDSFAEVRTLIADARSHMGPKLRATVAEALLRGRSGAEHLERRRSAHHALAGLSAAGARTAAAAFQAIADDARERPERRAEAVYALGKIRPTPPGTTEFLLRHARHAREIELVVFALAALLQLDPPAHGRPAAWLGRIEALHGQCERVDRQIAARAGRLGSPRARQYLAALRARWQASLPP